MDAEGKKPCQGGPYPLKKTKKKEKIAIMPEREGECVDSTLQIKEEEVREKGLPDMTESSGDLFFHGGWKFGKREKGEDT